jgi:hypothetical protein
MTAFSKAHSEINNRVDILDFFESPNQSRENIKGNECNIKNAKISLTFSILGKVLEVCIFNIKMMKTLNDKHNREKDRSIKCGNELLLLNSQLFRSKRRLTKIV